MRYQITILLAFIAVSAYATSIASSQKEQSRFLIATNSLSFTTFTILKVTTTTTSTLTITTTCTTSTAVILTCTTGRRRRGLFYDESEAQVRHRRAGLYYNEDDSENTDGTAFLPDGKESRDPSVEIVNTPVNESSLIPLEIEPGFTVREGGPNRFLLSFGTSTVTSISISYTTLSLTAICSSTTGFPLCGTSGK